MVLSAKDIIYLGLVFGCRYRNPFAVYPLFLIHHYPSQVRLSVTASPGGLPLSSSIWLVPYFAVLGSIPNSAGKMVQRFRWFLFYISRVLTADITPCNTSRNEKLFLDM